MNATVIIDVPEEITRFEPLRPGFTREAVLSFSSEWCRAYFNLSGDTNNDLHGDEGAGVVQGMGIMTRLGATISRHMPGYMVAKVGEVKFRNPVKIGHQVVMTMERLDGKDRATQVKTTLELVGGLPITEVMLLLVRREVP